MGTKIGLPFQGKAWYWIETTYGGGNAGSSYAISDTIVDIRISTGDKKKDFFTHSEPTVSDFLTTLNDPILHIEWVWQPNATSSLATLCCDRTATGNDLESLAFCIGANTGGTSSYWLVKGCKCKTINMNSSRGNEYTCSADFSVQSITTDTSATGSEPAAIDASSNPYAQFNKSTHSIVFSGCTDTPFFITDSIDITVDNNLTDYWDCDSENKVAAIPGQKMVTGSCDISMDEGGAKQWGNVVNPGDGITNIVLTLTGTSGALDETVTLTTGRFDNLDVNIATGGEGMMASQPFTFKQIAFS